ncbi:MAG: CtsR family transcriptional regulator [Oscillospiraceae bacterium]|nr:CtsR family transcriptional regulator [Oscillospiraceae bacterium]
MGISDVIAEFIDEMLSEADGTAELQRAELAGRFNCVPSQINYVISTRFSPEHGYIVESRRGGGGYIRIKRIAMEAKLLIMHTINTIGESIDSNTAAALIANLKQNNAISSDEVSLIMSAISNNALRPLSAEGRNIIRASILKQMLIHTKNI